MTVSYIIGKPRTTPEEPELLVSDVGWVTKLTFQFLAFEDVGKKQLFNRLVLRVALIVNELGEAGEGNVLIRTEDKLVTNRRSKYPAIYDDVGLVGKCVLVFFHVSH